MSYSLFEEQKALQPCPKCGRQALAQPRENLYRCLWCRFESDISDDGFNIPGGFFFVVVLVAAFVIFSGG